VLTVTPGWSEAYGLFTKGEAPMVLSYTTSPAYHMVAENTERYQAASFEEGDYLQIEVAGMTKAAKDPVLAKDFLSFMTGPEFQSIIPTTNWMMPVAATKEPLPEAFGKLVTPEKTFLMSSDEVAANRKAWIDEWLAAMSKFASSVRLPLIRPVGHLLPVMTGRRDLRQALSSPLPACGERARVRS
jgi:thiamine transport system substrate-binding protein